MKKLLTISIFILMFISFNSIFSNESDCCKMLEPDTLISAGKNTAQSVFMTRSTDKIAIAWNDGFETDSNVYFSLLDFSGNEIIEEVQLNDPSIPGKIPYICWNGTNYGVAWYGGGSQADEIYFTLLDANGNKIKTTRITHVWGWSRTPAVAWNGSEFGIAFFDYRDGNYEIYFARVDSEGNEIGDEFNLSRTPQASSNPDLIWNGEEYALVWNEGSPPVNNEIFFMRLDEFGNELDRRRITFSIGSSYSPYFAWTGDGYGVVWYDEREGYGKAYFSKIDRYGNKVIEDLPISDMASVGRPAIAWSGTDFGITWYADVSSFARVIEYYLTIIDNSGNKIDDDCLISEGEEISTVNNASVLWINGNWDVAWYEKRDTFQDIYFNILGCQIEAAIDLDPDTLNLKSKGNWMTCYIELPEGYLVSEIDILTVYLSVDGSEPIYAETSPADIDDYDYDGILDLMVKFDRSMIQSVAPVGDNVPFEVFGNLYSGTRFNGTDYIRIIDKGNQHQSDSPSSVE